MNTMLKEKDNILLEEKGISVEQLELQLSQFKTGFPFLTIISPATPARGILILDEEEKEKCINEWDKYTSGKHKIIKFVPASGAASRMFKDLFEFLDASYDLPTTNFEIEFFKRIKYFAFFNSLNAVCLKKTGKEIDELIDQLQYKTIVENLLQKSGLNYGTLPKGLLEFHRYEEGVRTPAEEHLVEGYRYAAGGTKKVNIHFTVSPEHRSSFETLISNKVKDYEKQFDVTYNISFSEQKSNTDTIAVDEADEPFRTGDKILFRPGGHGALIENLNELEANIIFVKNIDNVVPDSHKNIETQYKKILAGVLVLKQRKTFEYLQLLDLGSYNHDELIEILYFVQDSFCVKNLETKHLEDAELALYLKKKLNRPIRVCGMVKNVGEPGGGPFITVSSDGTTAPQILESSQIDLSKADNKIYVSSSTHFNPVDIICGVYDYRGKKFDLREHIDRNTGFISSKSKDGRALKALELPGLWNGAMSDWNTVFVEVPIETFNPVKTVNDLLRENHL